MNCTRKIFHYILPLLIFMGCAHIPTVDYPLEIQRVFDVPYDKTWNTVGELIKATEGAMLVNQDESSGLIVYSVLNKMAKSRIFMQVYLRPSHDRQATLVYLFPRERNGYYVGKIQSEFFEKLKEILEKSKK